VAEKLWHSLRIVGSLTERLRHLALHDWSARPGGRLLAHL